MQLLNLSLPEFAFLDGFSHEGNSLEGRNVLQHIRSYTILESFAEEDIIELSFADGVISKKYKYKNYLGINENHIMAIHFSLAEDEELEEIINKAIDWYCKYMEWEDKNIITDTNAQEN